MPPGPRPLASGQHRPAVEQKSPKTRSIAAGAIQNEGLLYMSYESAAVYDAVVAIEGGYQPYARANTRASRRLR